MKECDILQFRVCPLCGKPYTGHPALSRKDNETLICPDCGTRDALATLGIDEQEQNEILAVMNSIPRGCVE